MKDRTEGTALRVISERLPAELRWLEYPRAQLIETLRASLYTGAKPESVAMVLDYCATAGLNVMLKPVHIVPMNVKTGQNKFEWRDVIMPGINHYRTQASRSGCYVGKSEPEFGPDITRKWGSIDVTFPAWCRITVKRKIGDYIAEFAATEFWDENFASAGRDKPWPNTMWMKRPRGQLAKCTEAQALRMAFPEFAVDATAEEMEGKVMDLTAEAVDKPKAAIASLDQFSGSAPQEPEEATFDEVGHGDGSEAGESDPEASSGPETGNAAHQDPPTIPDEAIKAFRAGDWAPGWAWLVQTMPELTPEQRQTIAERHADLLWAVYESDAKDHGPQSKAAVKLSKDLGYFVPPLDKKARGSTGKATGNA
jgi:phage recombination protein Bet